MGMMEKLAGWFETPLPGPYKCVNCNSRFTDAEASCPECSNEIIIAEPEPELSHYWEAM